MMYFASRRLTRSSVVGLALSLVVALSLVPFVQGLDHPDDIAGLTALFNATGGPTWTRNTGWTNWINQPQLYSVCNAFGVTCSLIGQQPRVTALNLAQNRLQGTFKRTSYLLTESV
jgi:hypothetical protein